MSQPKLCHICGLRPAGSREHIPGVGAANDQPVTINYLGPSSDPRFAGRITRKERDGFYVTTICQRCNSRNGGHYGTAYKDFIGQFSASGILDAEHRRTWVSLKQIQPLRVLKQMAAMFLAVQGELNIDHWEQLRRFVLRRDAKLDSDTLRFYLYRNTTDIGRIVGIVGLGFIFEKYSGDPAIFSEISWPPLGIIFTTDPNPLFSSMVDITDWGKYSFRHRKDFGFSVPQYEVRSHWPLGFGSPAAVEAWINRTGAIWLGNSAEKGDHPAHFTALVKKLPAIRMGGPQGSKESRESGDSSSGEL